MNVEVENKIKKKYDLNFSFLAGARLKIHR